MGKIEIMYLVTEGKPFFTVLKVTYHLGKCEKYWQILSHVKKQLQPCNAIRLVMSGLTPNDVTEENICNACPNKENIHHQLKILKKVKGGASTISPSSAVPDG